MSTSQFFHGSARGLGPKPISDEKCNVRFNVNVDIFYNGHFSILKKKMFFLIRYVPTYWNFESMGCLQEARRAPQINAGADGPDARFECQVRRARLARNQARHHAALPRGRLHPRPQHALQDVQLDNLRVNLVDGERNQLAPGVEGELPPPQQQQGRRCRGRMPTPMSTSTTPSSCGDSWDLRRCDYIAWNGERRRVTQQAGTDKLNKWLNIDQDKQPGPKAAQNHKARREQMLAALLRAAHPNHTDLRPKPAGNVDRRKSKRDQRA